MLVFFRHDIDSVSLTSESSTTISSITNLFCSVAYLNFPSLGTNSSTAKPKEPVEVKESVYTRLNEILDEKLENLIPAPVVIVLSIFGMIFESKMGNSGHKTNPNLAGQEHN